MKLALYLHKYSNLGLNLILTFSNFVTLPKLLNLWKSQVKTTSTLQDSKLIRDDTCTARCLTFRSSHQMKVVITIIIIVIIGM